MCPTFPPLLPLPRLTLKLSNSTILDTILLDARDLTPLFTIETVGNQTALYHTAAAANRRLSHVAAVHWPASNNQKHKKKEKDAIIFIDTQTVPSSAFLKKTVLGGSRKFHVPGQSHPLKWKHVGSHWECTLCSHACTAHRAVATFEPAHTTSTARLNVYADTVLSSRTYPETGIHAQYDGVDMDMLAYLVLTSMLLTTQPHAWQDLNTNPLPLTEKYTTHQLHQLAPMITTSSPSTSSYKAPRIDLLSDDLSHSPLRGSPTSQSSSCYSSLPPSPLTPNMDLSPIHHDTFASFAPGASSSSTNSNSSCAGTGTNTPTSSVFRRNSRNSNRMPSPLITCSTFSNSSSSSSPTTATPNTPAGPSAITPYHLPPAPCPSTPSTPHSLHPHHSHALPHHSHSPTHHSHHHHHHHHHHNHTQQQQQQQQQQRSHTNNALHLDTSHAVVVASPVLPYTTQMYNIQFAGEAPPPQPQSNQQQVQAQVSNDELPPAYNEIEWTVRVKQPRNGGPRPLRVQ